jgi:NADH dehydrogenase
LTVPGHPEVFVVGDLAALADQHGRQLPAVAQVAIQGGTRAALNIMCALRGAPLEPFRYVDLGSMATIGRHAAVVDLGWLRLSGFVAWLMWLVVHLRVLVGFRNRNVVLFQWIWTYLTRQRSARLIRGGGG